MGTCFNTSATAGWLCSAGCPAIHQIRAFENNWMPTPTASPPLPALPRSPAKVRSLPAPPLAIWTSPNTTDRWSKSGLWHPLCNEERNLPCLCIRENTQQLSFTTLMSFQSYQQLLRPWGWGRAKLQDNMISAKNTKHFVYGTGVEKSGWTGSGSVETQWMATLESHLGLSRVEDMQFGAFFS